MNANTEPQPPANVVDLTKRLKPEIQSPSTYCHTWGEMFANALYLLERGEISTLSAWLKDCAEAYKNTFMPSDGGDGSE